MKVVFSCFAAPGLSFDSVFLCAPLFLVLFCHVILPSPVDHSVFLFLLLVLSPAYFPETSLKIFSTDRHFYFILPLFLVVFHQLGDEKLVSNKYSMLLYGTGISNLCI